MTRKLIIIFLSLTIFVSGFSGVAMAEGLDNFRSVKTYTQGQFVDVKSSAWYAVNVKEAYEYDLINGKDSTHFDPAGSLTVAEAIKLGACLNSIYNNGTVNIGKSDASGSTSGGASGGASGGTSGSISASNSSDASGTGGASGSNDASGGTSNSNQRTHWYQPYVDYAKENGIISKDFDDYNRAVTRLEFASIFANAMPADALEKINTVEDDAIPDLPMLSNGADSVYKLYRAGILTGNDSKGTFSPNSNVARSEAAAITTRMANTSLRRFITLTKKSTGSSLTAEQISAKCSSAVFYLEVYGSNGVMTGSGSGFFIDSNGTAVTNYHVIDGASYAKIYTTDGNGYEVSGVYDYDEERDVALLKIDGSGFNYLNIDKGDIANGMTIFTIGSPSGLDNTISQGLISNANRTIGGQRYIQISAPISHGSSGGALLNTSGSVIGITSAVIDEAQNLNFAIPISAIDSLSRTTAATLISIAGGSVGQSYDRPIISQSKITVGVGNTTVVTVTSTNPDSDSVFYDFSGTSADYIECEWGEWDGDSIPLYIKGLHKGTVKVRIYECDEYDNQISSDSYITVNITSATVSSSYSYSYYYGYYPAVDFGALFGISAEYVKDSDNSKIHAYLASDISRVDASGESTKKYVAALEKSGFEFYFSYDNDDGNPVLCYRNSQYGVIVSIGVLNLNSNPYFYVITMYE